MTDTVDPNQLQSVMPAEVTDVPKDTREKVGGVLRGLVGSQGGSLDQLIAKHHQERLDQANMHRRTAAAAMAAYSYGIDPETGNPLTPEQEQKYLNEWNASMEQFTKVAGVNKETKAAILRNKQLIEGMAQQRRQQQQRGGPPQPPAMAGVPGEQGAGQLAGMPGTTSTGTTAAATPGPQGGGPTASPLAQAYSGSPMDSGPPRVPGSERLKIPFAEQAPFLMEQLRQRQALDAYKSKSDIDVAAKIAEEKGKNTAAPKPPSSAIGAWWQANEAQGHTPTPDEVTRASAELRPVSGDPIKALETQATKQEAAGDTDGAKKTLEFVKQLANAKKGGTTAGTSLLAVIMRAKDPNATPEERALATQAVKDYTAQQYAIRSAYAIERSKRDFGTFEISSGPDKGRVATMSKQEAYQRQQAGEQISYIGQPSYPTVTGLQKFVKEAPAAIAELRTPITPGGKTPLDAYDNASDRAIFARVFAHVGAPAGGDETSWAGRMLDQLIKEKDNLSPEGRKLIPALSRLNDTVFTVQTALGAQKTDAATALFMTMLPGPTTPDAEFAKAQLNAFEANAKNSLTPAMQGLVDVPPEWREPGYQETPPSVRPRGTAPSKSGGPPPPKSTATGGTVHFVEGSDEWNIPQKDVDRFRKAHPNAQPR